MNTDSEESFVARFARRPALGIAALALLGLSATTLWLRGAIPTPEPERAPFDPVACAAELDTQTRIDERMLGVGLPDFSVIGEILETAACAPDLCLNRLPGELQDLPTTQQYAAWRTFDVVDRLILPVDPSQQSAELQLELAEAILTSANIHVVEWMKNEALVARDRSEAVLASIDSWVQNREAESKRQQRALLALGGERDWSSPPPELPGAYSDLFERLSGGERLLAQEATRRNMLVRTEAWGIVGREGVRLGRERQLRLEAAWRQVELDDARQALSRLVAYRDDVFQWWCLSGLFLGTMLAGTGLGIAAVRRARASTDMGGTNAGVFVSPEEVSATARFPDRTGLGAGALATLGLALACILYRGAPPTFMPEPTLFDPSVCTPPRPELCLSTLSPELRRLPTREQYLRWRTVDLVRKAVRSRVELLDQVKAMSLGDPTSFWDAEDMVETMEVSASFRIEQRLAEIDPWVALLRSKEINPTYGYDGSARQRRALLDLGAERDWILLPPPLPQVSPPEALERKAFSKEDRIAVQMAVTENLLVREKVAEMLQPWANRFERERRAMFAESLEERAEAEDSERQRALVRHEFAHDRWTFLGWVARAAGLVGIVLGAAWTWFEPRGVVVGLHQLRIGRRTIPWSAVSSVDWAAQPGRVCTASEVYTLGRLVLPPEAIASLEAASERAMARTKTLSPLDTDALRDLEKLR